MKHGIGIIETVVIAASPEVVAAALAAGHAVVLCETRFRVEAVTPLSIVLASPDGTRAYLALARIPGGTRVALVHASVPPTKRDVYALGWRLALATLRAGIEARTAAAA